MMGKLFGFGCNERCVFFCFVSKMLEQHFRFINVDKVLLLSCFAIQKLENCESLCNSRGKSGTTSNEWPCENLPKYLDTCFGILLFGLWRIVLFGNSEKFVILCHKHTYHPKLIHSYSHTHTHKKGYMKASKQYAPNNLLN